MNRKQTSLVSFSLLFLCLAAIRISALEIKQTMWNGVLSDYLAGQIIVVLKPNTNQVRFDSLVQVIRGIRLDSISGTNAYLLSIDPETSVVEVVNYLKSHNIIQFAEPNLVYYPAGKELYQDSLWGFHNFGQIVNNSLDTGVIDVDADLVEAWSIETGDTSVFISVIDDGIAMDLSGNLIHPDLNDESRIRLDTAFNGSRLALRDSSGHGTSVLGVVAAKKHADSTGLVGVAYDCKFLVTKAVYNDVTSGWHLSKAIMHVCSLGVNVISCSFWGGHQTLTEIAVDTALGRNVLITAAAGNFDFAPVAWPAAYAFWGTRSGHTSGYSNVISVSGIKNNDKHVGAVSNDTQKVAVVAPARSIFSAWPNYLNPFSDFRYTTLVSTSQATPLVAGIAGLLLANDPSLKTRPDSVRKIIQNTADKIWRNPNSISYDPDSLDYDWHINHGYGRVNAYKALLRLVIEPPSNLAGTVERTPTPRIVLSWTDNSMNEDSFTVERTTIDSVGAYKKRGKVNQNDTAFTDSTNLMGSEDYIYRIKAHTEIVDTISNLDTVHNIPNAPVQNTPSVVFGSSAQCCGGFSMVPCNTKSNKVIVSWNAPLNQKESTLASYKIKVKKLDTEAIFWFTQPWPLTRDTLCLWTNTACSLWVYSVDSVGEISNTPLGKRVVTGPCRLCEPPANERVWLPYDDDDYDKSRTQKLPKEFDIAQNYPNPFNLATQINFALPQDAEVEITIYDILGRRIRSYNLGSQSAGYKSFTWDGKNDKGEAVSSGIYFYNIKAGQFTETKKMTLLK